MARKQSKATAPKHVRGDKGRTLQPVIVPHLRDRVNPQSRFYRAGMVDRVPAGVEVTYTGDRDCASGDYWFYWDFGGSCLERFRMAYGQFEWVSE